MSDFESDETWLKKLGELNAVIAGTGQPLIGNLFYDHLQEDYLHSPPNPILQPKRERFRTAIAGRSRLLEVGVNGGHSAFLALSSDPKIQFHGVDICEHAYVRPATDWLKREFPGRVFFYEGDCREILPRLARKGLWFDAFHIDGAKFTYFEDVRNCQRMTRPEAVVILDDSQQEGVSGVVRRCVRQGRIQPMAQFPPMSPANKYRHEIGLLRPAPTWRTLIFRFASPVRRSRRSALVQRLESTMPRQMRRNAMRAVSLVRHPVTMIRRRSRRTAVGP